VLKTSGTHGTTEWCISSPSTLKLISQMRLMSLVDRALSLLAHLLQVVLSLLGWQRILRLWTERRHLGLLQLATGRGMSAHLK
jgi:hypothetical protein